MGAWRSEGAIAKAYELLIKKKSYRCECRRMEQGRPVRFQGADRRGPLTRREQHPERLPGGKEQPPQGGRHHPRLPPTVRLRRVRTPQEWLAAWETCRREPPEGDHKFKASGGVANCVGELIRESFSAGARLEGVLAEEDRVWERMAAGSASSCPPLPLPVSGGMERVKLTRAPRGVPHDMKPRATFSRPRGPAAPGPWGVTS